MIKYKNTSANYNFIMQISINDLLNGFDYLLL